MTTDHLFLLASSRWTSLRLYDHVFKSELELIRFMGLIEPTVEELTLNSVKTASSKRKEIGHTNFVFPKLKRLYVSKSCSFICSEIFKNVQTLESFEIETEATSTDETEILDLPERVKGVQSILVKNSGIANLSLYLHQKDFDHMFSEDRFLSLIRFQLVTLKIKKFKKHVDGFDTNVLQVINFGKFVALQKKSLSSLYLLEWLGNSFLEVIINTLDSLKVLKLENLESYGRFGDFIANLNLFKNESIESLYLNTKQTKCSVMLKAILSIVPNLKYLSIGTVNQEVFQIVIEKISKIEKIEAGEFIPYILPDGEVLKCLKEITINIRYAKNFKDMLRDYDYYTNFETVFLKATKKFDEKYPVEY